MNHPDCFGRGRPGTGRTVGSVAASRASSDHDSEMIDGSTDFSTEPDKSLPFMGDRKPDGFLNLSRLAEKNPNATWGTIR